MPLLPTDGFSTSDVTYTLETSDNLSVTVTVKTNTEERREAAEVFLTYLEAALNSLRTEYANGTDQEVLYIERAYDATVRDQLTDA